MTEPPGIVERLRSGELRVADGAMGTLLFERGLCPGECPEALNLERPELLEEIAALYFEAGAEIVQTNTFGGSPMKLADYGLEDRTEEINARAVEAVRRAVGDRALVSGSCGPSTKILEPYGDVDPEALQAGFERQVRALAGAGVDLLCIETMTDLREAVLAIRAAKRAAPATPVMATMTFDPTPRGFFTIMGVGVEAAARGLAEAGAGIVGTNCGNGLDGMIEIARAFRACTDRPILVQSNAGAPANHEGRLVYPESPAFFAERTGALLDAGVSIIGGCCGTTPAHIRAIRRVVDERRGRAGA